MKKLAILLLLFPCVSFAQERPVVNLPIELRESNWVGSDGSGSCCHATTTMILRWQQHAKSEYWRATYSGGDWANHTWNPRNNHAQKLDNEAITFAYTLDGDERFLDWALATRRGAGITVQGGRHAVLLVHLDDEWAAIIDNNNIDEVQWVPRQTLINEWRASNMWAWTIVESPVPPLPKEKQ